VDDPFEWMLLSKKITKEAEDSDPVEAEDLDLEEEAEGDSLVIVVGTEMRHHTLKLMQALGEEVKRCLQPQIVQLDRGIDLVTEVTVVTVAGIVLIEAVTVVVIALIEVAIVVGTEIDRESQKALNTVAPS
jgi:hypothetical protein